MPNARRASNALTIALLLLAGCGDEERRPRPTPPVEAPSSPTLSVAEMTGWPEGLGRALVVRLASGDEQYRLVVPEFGARRFADSGLAMKPGDVLPVVLLDRGGQAGTSSLRIVDSEAGAGSCVTWPAAELTGTRRSRRRSAAAQWRAAVERDSVAPISLDSLAGLRGVDSLRLVAAVNSLLASLPAPRDSAFHGIPYTIRRAYSFTAAGAPTIAAELVRTSGQEADPREERLFVIGERVARDPARHRLGYSRRTTGRADSVAVTELLAVVVPKQSSRPVLIIGLEDSTGTRIALVARVGPGRWRSSWSSVITFC